MLKSNEDIQGIKIGGEEYKLSQFADDTTILLDGQEKSLVETMKTLRLFASLSGLKINSSEKKLYGLVVRNLVERPSITGSNLNGTKRNSLS